MKKSIYLLLALAAIATITSCKKEEEPPQLPASTHFTMNGVEYASNKNLYIDYGFGAISWADSATAVNGSKILWIFMNFNLTGSKPTTGNYDIFTDSLTLVTPDHVEFNIQEYTPSHKLIAFYKIQTPVNGYATVVNINDQVALTIPAQTLAGLPCDSTSGTVNGPGYTVPLSAVTFSEKN